jgi:parvulin-like peptidyl-prolyl isomerase
MNMSSIRVGVVVSAALLAALWLGSCTAGNPEESGQTAQPQDAGKQVVAKVNGVPVYAADLNLGLTRLQQKEISGGQTGELKSEEVLREEALQLLIENELLFQEAQRRGFTAAREAVDEEMAAIAGQFPGPATFEKALAQMSVTREDLWRDLERAHTVERMVESAIEPGVSVNAEEVRAYYDANPGLFTDPERIHVRHVFLRVDPSTTEEQKAEMRRTLEGLRKRALQGESFEALADQYSQDPRAGKGGDLGYLTRGQLAKDFEQAVFALQAGQISGVVSSTYGYHLVQAVDHQPQSSVSFEKVKDPLSGFLRRRKVDEAVNALAKELRDKAKISIPKKRK